MLKEKRTSEVPACRAERDRREQLVSLNAGGELGLQKASSHHRLKGDRESRRWTASDVDGPRGRFRQSRNREINAQSRLPQKQQQSKKEKAE